MIRHRASDTRPHRIWHPVRLPSNPGTPRAHRVVVDRQGNEFCRVFRVTRSGGVDSRPYMARPDELHEPAAWEARHGPLD